jgi:hypothetical protein
MQEKARRRSSAPEAAAVQTALLFGSDQDVDELAASGAGAMPMVRASSLD